MSREALGGPLLLETRGLSKRYGGIAALDGVDLRMRQGEVLGIIGPNGAGKSTLVGVLSGILPATAGSVHLLGADVTALAPHARAKRGIARTYQIPQPFAQMTVAENVSVALTHGRRGAGGDDVGGILRRTGLAEYADVPAGDLSLLRLKRLELARALALRPQVLLLDEVAAGLVPSEVWELVELIRALRAEVGGILIVEHVMEVIRACCDRVMVLNWGRRLAEGTPEEVLSDPEVVEVYLGTAGDGKAPDLHPAARPPKDVPPQLRLSGVSAAYGSFRALHGVDIEVREGEIVALLGANGAGKSTVARVMSGMLPAASGELQWRGERVPRGWSPHLAVLGGIAHCMEGRRTFGDLSVEENLRVAARRASRSEADARIGKVYGLFPVLGKRRRDPGTALSGGEQQMLAIGRALMSAPKLIVFDEISLGLAPVIIDGLYEKLVDINASGVSMVVIEQNVERGLQIAHRAYVLENGRVELSGTPDEIRSDPRLQALYVGGVDAAG